MVSNPVHQNYQLDPQSKRIYYLEQGHAPETVLLLHGHGAKASLYLPLIEALSPHFRVLAPDLPGYGRSAALHRKNISQYIADIEQFIATHIKTNFYLIGHSFGGLLAYLLKQRAQIPTVTRAVWMEAAIFELDWKLRLALPIYGTAQRFRPHSRQEIEKRMAKISWNYAGGNIASRETFIRNYCLSDRHTEGLFLSEYASLLPWKLEQLEVPTLCIRGEKDTFIARATTRIAQVLPQGQEVIIPQTGHFLIDENNPVLNQTILDFLQASEPIINPTISSSVLS